jgi:uncharacterized membrane protein required for colicin V production
MLSFTIFSFMRGMMKEVLGLLGIAMGFLAASWYAPNLAEIVRPLLPDAKTSELLAFILIMMAGYFVGTFLAGFGSQFLPSPKSFSGRMIGGAIGFGKGLVFALALFWVVKSYIPPFQDELARSRIGGILGEIIVYFQKMNWI